MSTAAPTLAHALAAALARHAHHAFGLMGNGNAHLIQSLGDLGVPYTAVRHEAATVAAADAYTRVSGRLAIATTTYGAGFTNALTALAEAAQARTPMLVAVGDAPSGGPRPWDVDQEMLAAALGVRTHTLSVTGIERTVDRAVAYAQRVRRPVVLAIPYDLAAAATVEPASSLAPATPPPGIDLADPAVLASLSASVAGTLPATEAAGPGATSADGSSVAEPGPGTAGPGGGGPAAHQIDAAVQALLHAERPVIIAGRGAHLAGAASELGELADALGALTGTTALARGIFPEQRFDLGVVGGFGQHDAMATIQSADAAVVVGASLNQFTMRFGDLFGPGTAVIRIDEEPLAPPASNHPITHMLLQGDARSSLRSLLAAFTDAGGSPSGWREATPGLEAGGTLRVRDTGRTAHPEGLCGDGRLDPRAVAARIGELLPAERHVASDGGHFIGWANMFWPVAAPERMIMVGTAYQTIGLGLPSVAGVAAAAPHSTTVLSTGDGGALMALADLETAIRCSASGVIVVWNDGAYGAEVHLYGTMGLDQEPMLIPEVDFAALATALGAQGVRVERLADLDALGDWTAAGARGTILLDCRVSRSVVAEYQREIQRANGLDVPAR
ncbi:thiamine pyrophosphate-binding protein [Leucobacter massiliensis]|uniref:Thiamine pyrophosphate-binding protein n=1 Tax=Leucobacter massiliensis TaxID=1686285 RepID=A0A2S9QK48_9MICO|nr:thiamine pyrophosphate-binding protein [Leucobacter massiliensis]PRI09979.1 thiamine pyrophosphate-binding protein [Leucobacter massiliensis]